MTINEALAYYELLLAQSKLKIALIELGLAKLRLATDLYVPTSGASESLASSFAPFSRVLNTMAGGVPEYTYSATQGLRQLCGLPSDAPLIDTRFSLVGEQNHCFNSAVKHNWRERWAEPLF